MGKLIIPKASQMVEEAEHAIQIYYEASDWLDNKEFIQRYKDKFGLVGRTGDNSAYTKRVQIGAYFGFIEWENIKKTTSRRRITPRGKNFWEHVSAKNVDAVFEDIFLALKEVTFGRRNFACYRSDSDLEPMSIFFHSALTLEYLTNMEFAYILWKMEAENESLDSAITMIQEMRQSHKRPKLPKEYKHLKQPTPLYVLGGWGILCQTMCKSQIEHRISDAFISKYREEIPKLKVWNTAKPGPLPIKSALRSVEDESSLLGDISGSDVISDAVYQDLVDAAKPIRTSYKPERYISQYPNGKEQKSNRPTTNPSLGKEAIKAAKYKCSIDKAHTTFIKKDGTTFMEVHHLIPLGYQSEFEFKLDTKANLVSICPLCHKRLHYGRIEDKTPILTCLYNKRKALLEKSGLFVTLEKLLTYYE